MRIRIIDNYTITKETLVEIPDEINGVNTLELIQKSCDHSSLDLDELNAVEIEHFWDNEPIFSEDESYILTEDREEIGFCTTYGNCLA